MILGEKDWTKAKAIIRKHKSRIDFLQRRFADARVSEAANAHVQRLEKRIGELVGQLRAYDALVMRTAKVPLPTDLTRLAEHLISRRIRAGVTQSEFAELLGCHRRSYARYEATFYASVSLSRVIQIDRILRELEDAQNAQIQS